MNKLYGKSKIYHVNQDTLPVADADTIAALDNRIKELSQQLSSIQQQHSALSHSLSQMENAPSTEDAIKLVEKLKAEVWSTPRPGPISFNLPIFSHPIYYLSHHFASTSRLSSVSSTFFVLACSFDMSSPSPSSRCVCYFYFRMLLD